MRLRRTDSNISAILTFRSFFETLIAIPHRMLSSHVLIACSHRTLSSLHGSHRTLSSSDASVSHACFACSHRTHITRRIFTITCSISAFLLSSFSSFSTIATHMNRSEPKCTFRYPKIAIFFLEGAEKQRKQRLPFNLK